MSEVPTSDQWNGHFCWPWGVKGAGSGPCIFNTLNCMCCMWASATSQVKGKEEWGSYVKCCILAGLCPCCTFAQAYNELSAHYGIKHSPTDAGLKFCLPVLSYFQLLNEMLRREQLHMVYVNVEPDAPVVQVMARNA